MTGLRRNGGDANLAYSAGQLLVPFALTAAAATYPALKKGMGMAANKIKGAVPVSKMAAKIKRSMMPKRSASPSRKRAASPSRKRSPSKRRGGAPVPGTCGQSGGSDAAYFSIAPATLSEAYSPAAAPATATGGARKSRAAPKKAGTRARSASPSRKKSPAKRRPASGKGAASKRK